MISEIIKKQDEKWSALKEKFKLLNTNSNKSYQALETLLTYLESESKLNGQSHFDIMSSKPQISSDFKTFVKSNTDFISEVSKVEKLVAGCDLMKLISENNVFDDYTKMLSKYDYLGTLSEKEVF